MTSTEESRTELMDWHDVARTFRCGRSKAMGIVHELGPIYIGRTPYVTETQLKERLAADGEIKVDWRRTR